MTLKDWYYYSGSDYESAMKRLLTEERVIKYLHKFAESSAYKDMIDAWKAKDYEATFMAVHNIKGVCANLGLTRLWEASDALCEDLRGGTPSDAAPELMMEVRQCYAQMMEAPQNK
ncbi:MAG: Hpt domain-containing protein [Clostridiales bacterium]|nr:Hpt domain-containing protein [Clostridiales bacterium]